ncbi:hypothetical protein [Lichenibacterium minor]|nr:hypothetical protein [Lichenibacterium minor]
MSAHELHALRHPHVVAFHKFFSEYHIYFQTGAERFRVSIRVYETDDGRYFFEQSHYIRTPVQESANVLTAETHAGPHHALSRAVESITTYYEDALGQGHRPAAEWFVRNDVY